MVSHEAIIASWVTAHGYIVSVVNHVNRSPKLHPNISRNVVSLSMYMYFHHVHAITMNDRSVFLLVVFVATVLVSYFVEMSAEIGKFKGWKMGLVFALLYP